MSMSTGRVSGEVAAGFEPVREMFAEHLDELGEGGAAFAVVLKGELVVDLWAGCAGAELWRRETRAVLMSATKGIATIALARLVERGLIDIDAPIGRYWPEFAAAGKEEVTVAHVLSHSSGVITVPGYEEFLGPNGEGWDKTAEIIRRLESARPEWPPGSSHSYHGITFGWMISELVRRAAGVSIGTIVREEIAEPLGLELDLGTPLEKQRMVAPVIRFGAMPPSMVAFKTQLADPTSLLSRMMLAINGESVVSNIDRFLTAPVLAGEYPFGNATGTARALATLYGVLANGGRHRSVELLSPRTIEVFSTERRRGPEEATGLESRWALGFMRPVPRAAEAADEAGAALGHRVWGIHDEAFGHEGGGGQLGFADPVSKVGAGFLRSHLSWDSRLSALLVHAFYECLPLVEVSKGSRRA